MCLSTTFDISGVTSAIVEAPRNKQIECRIYTKDKFHALGGWQYRAVVCGCVCPSSLPTMWRHGVPLFSPGKWRLGSGGAGGGSRTLTGR